MNNKVLVSAVSLLVVCPLMAVASASDGSSPGLVAPGGGSPGVAAPGVGGPATVAARAAVASAAQIPADELAGRRARLMEMLGDGLYYLEGAPAPANDYDTWAQTSEFHYLTGFEEPDARLLMRKAGDETRAVLFVRQRNLGREIWEGHRLGPDGAAELTGMEARPLEDFEAVLAELLRGAPAAVVSVEGPADDETVATIHRRMGSGTRLFSSAEAAEGVRWVDPRGALRRLRAVKSATEIELLEMASLVTEQAHLAAMQAIEPGMNEFEIEALIEYEFRRYGARRPGFASIVGSGPNSTVLHYNANDRFMQAGEMLVMDIGAEYGRYTTDITRSVPVSGTFTAEQREIYEIVLAAQLAAEERAREIGASRGDLSTAASSVLAEGLARLGLIESAEATLPGSRRPQLGLFYMHGLGHGIGLDVHDPDTARIEVGSCFTIEPGLYIREDALDRIGEGPEADALRERLRGAIVKYADIGVRIEDSYCFTAAGLRRLSAGIPRSVDEIEATMAADSLANQQRRAELVERYRELQRHRRRRD